MPDRDGDQRGDQHSGGREPQNTKLWAMLTAQAKQRFRVYPSIPASKWVHDEYLKRGGQFVTTKKRDDRHKHGKLTREGAREEHAEQEESARTVHPHKRVSSKKKVHLG